jgi:hypothetical protein
LFDGDLVKGLLGPSSTATIDEGNSNLLLFVLVALVDGVSADSGAGLGEKSLCGE